jgi:endoglucanase
MRASFLHTGSILMVLQALLPGCGDGEPRIQNRPAADAAGGSSETPGEAVAGEAGTPDGVAGAGAEQVDTGAAGAVAAGGVTSVTGAAGAAGIAGAKVKLATPIAANSALTVDRSSNSLGIQGTWAPTLGTDSTLTMTAAGTRLCFNGSTAAVPLLQGTEYDYANYSGAAATLNLCRSGATDAPPDTAYALGSCPFGTDLAKSIAGVRFTLVEGATLPRELRVVFKEQGRTDSPYVVVGTVGQVTALIKEASIPTDSSAAPVNASKLESLQFFAFPSRRAAYPFNFCIENLEVLTGTGWSALPDWIYTPGPGLNVELGGVNLASAEFGEQNLPGTYAKDYIYPSNADVDIYAKANMNVIRLPFRWERLQRALGTELDATELSRLDAVVQYATGKGLTVILDPHNYGRYAGAVLGADLDIAMFADFWGRLATVYAQNPKVAFGLMNEPHDMPSTESWLSAANAAIAAIRGVGANNLILVPGNSWTGAHSWAASGYGTPNSQVMGSVVDPAKHFVFELHQYLDSDSSGTHAACVSDTIGVERVQTVTAWLRTNQFRGFLGEFNGGANDGCYRAIDNLLTYLGENSDVWLGWAVWAGGPWWGENILTVQPKNDGTERPQMTVLKRHLPVN